MVAEFPREMGLRCDLEFIRQTGARCVRHHLRAQASKQTAMDSAGSRCGRAPLMAKRHKLEISLPFDTCRVSPAEPAYRRRAAVEASAG